MQPGPRWIFGPFRLDLDNGCLWHGTEMISLPPTLLTLLHYLVTHAGQLVTKEELLAAVWPETAVGDAVLKVRIGDLRKMLGETARAPQCIATVHRYGYRFIASVTTATYAQGEHSTRALSSSSRSRSAPQPFVAQAATGPTCAGPRTPPGSPA